MKEISVKTDFYIRANKNQDGRVWKHFRLFRGEFHGGNIWVDELYNISKEDEKLYFNDGRIELLKSCYKLNQALNFQLLNNPTYSVCSNNEVNSHVDVWIDKKIDKYKRTYVKLTQYEVYKLRKMQGLLWRQKSPDQFSLFVTTIIGLAITIIISTCNSISERGDTREQNQKLDSLIKVIDEKEYNIHPQNHIENRIDSIRVIVP